MTSECRLIERWRERGGGAREREENEAKHRAKREREREREREKKKKVAGPGHWTLREKLTGSDFCLLLPRSLSLNSEW